LLEIVYRRPVIIKPMRASNPKPRPTSRKPETGSQPAARGQKLEARS
jgi:hypothetical protein